MCLKTLILRSNYLGKGLQIKTIFDCYALFLTGFQPSYHREGLLGCYSRGNPQVLPDHHRGEGQVEEGTRTGPASLLQGRSSTLTWKTIPTLADLLELSGKRILTLWENQSRYFCFCGRFFCWRWVSLLAFLPCGGIVSNYYEPAKRPLYPPFAGPVESPAGSRGHACRRRAEKIEINQFNWGTTMNL